MSMIRIGVDAYGGDNAPEAVIEGALFALKKTIIYLAMN